MSFRTTFACDENGIRVAYYFKANNCSQPKWPLESKVWIRNCSKKLYRNFLIETNRKLTETFYGVGYKRDWEFCLDFDLKNRSFVFLQRTRRNEARFVTNVLSENLRYQEVYVKKWPLLSMTLISFAYYFKSDWTEKGRSPLALLAKKSSEWTSKKTFF